MFGRTILVFSFAGLLTLPSVLGQPVNKISNASFEIADSTNPNLASSWQGMGNSYTRVIDPTPWDGKASVSLSANGGAYQKVVLNQAFPLPVRISVRVKGNSIADDPTDKLGASLDCKVVYHDGTIGYCPTTQKTKNVGTFDWKWVGYNTANFVYGGHPIDTIEVRVRMGAVSGSAIFDDVHVEEWTPSSVGMVTFMFDDGFLSTYTKAYPLLRNSGYVGTEAPIVSYLGADSIHMTLSQLHELYANGWSIVSHTVHHPDMTTLSLASLNDELYWSQKFLVDNGFPVEHIAMPFGAYNATVIGRAQAERYMGYAYKSVRTSDAGFNSQGVFPYNIYVQSVVSTTTAQDVANWCASARSSGLWLVLLIHEVDSTSNGQYTVSSQTLKDIVDVVRSSGLLVVTYDEGFKKITSAN